MAAFWDTTTATIFTIVTSWGTIEPIEFESYQALATRFHEEVMELWRKEDEQR
jgi:hypothetical protein